MPIITSLLDTDFYKFTMQQAAFLKYPDAEVEYAFKWRNFKDMQLSIPLALFASRINEELDHLCTLRFAKDEIAYLARIPYFRPGYIEFLRLFQLNRDHIRVCVRDGELRIAIRGPWTSTILFETPVLAIVAELYARFNLSLQSPIVDPTTEAEHCLVEKINHLNCMAQRNSRVNFSYIDMGTRRRWSKAFHEFSIGYQKEYASGFKGTSNVWLSKKYGLTPKGTQAHEWFQAHQQLGPRLVDSQAAALQAWADVYRGELGIALSDCLGFDAFLADFDRYFALLFDGMRHDSGDPFEWGQKAIDHYNALRIDPQAKQLIFSDGLDFDKAMRLTNRFAGRIGVSHGIGTYLTHDIGVAAPQIVIKMTRCNGGPVAKLSDTPGKGMCQDAGYLGYLHRVVAEKVWRG